MIEMFERFVSAVERIAAAMESRADSIAVAAEVLEEHREAVSTEPDREAIKKDLDALDISYAAKARTDTLVQLLADAKKAAPEQKPLEQMPLIDALAEIRAGLKACAMKHGTEKAREMLQLHAGGAENVSAIKPKYYETLLTALKEI